MIDVNFEVDHEELFTLLGHNGAGKSTLIHILVGINAPTSGSAEVAGFDVETDIEEVRKVMGYCPQHDILWEELTAFEHLLFFSQLKGRTYSEAVQETKEKLAEVNLTDVQTALVGTFSGGMKRRLSVAISAIGNPVVIIMDEPTTGMDPISKRQVWELIKRLKKNRCILLTTHSMEEADILSDRIAIIVSGELKCIGTSLYLKNTFGSGYKLSFVTNEPKELKRGIAEIEPEAELLSESAASLMYTIPHGKIEEIGKLFECGIDRFLEGKKSEGLVEDWGLSHSTIEEVFMRVTGKLTDSNVAKSPIVDGNPSSVLF